MASNNLVPVQLNPTLNKNDTTAYLNENFRAIGDAFNPIRLSDGANDRVLIGRYVHDTGIYYGYFGFDNDGTLVKYEGTNPSTGKYGSYITKTGLDVIDELLA